jgi:hypothetical protein
MNNLINIKDYTETDFNDDLYHYSGNNDYYVDNSLIKYTSQYHQNHRGINVDKEVAVEKLGKPNFINDYNDDNYWIFDFEGDRYYYQNNAHGEGCSVGIYCKKRDKSKNWLFEPVEYEYSRSVKLGEKMLNFTKAISDKLK